MTQTKTELQRVYIEDAAEIKRLMRLLAAEHDKDISFGDAVSMCKQAFFQQRPDLARKVQQAAARV